MKISTHEYQKLKKHYDDIINADKTHYLSSNDEPTPIGCVEEMLEKVPESFWHNQNIKILDPCCGTGNFGLVALDKLRKAGHGDQHILENILYFNDLSVMRLKKLQHVFCSERYKLNITSEDFLQQDFFNEKFNLIMANPPYAKMTSEGKRASKNHTLVRDFISKSLSLLEEDGFLVYIVPDNWMSLADRNHVISELTSNQFLWLDIHRAKRWFSKVGSSFTWFVLKKTPASQPYNVSGKYKTREYQSQILAEKRDYIPLLWTSEVQSILSKTIDIDNEKFKIETSSDLHAYNKKTLLALQQDADHPYKLHHTAKQVRWAARPHKFQDGWKVFITTTDQYKTFLDDCGMTQSIAFIRCKNYEEAQEFKAILDHPLYKFINDICRWGNFNNIRILQRLPMPTNKDNIYSSFGLTNKEISFCQKYYD